MAQESTETVKIREICSVKELQQTLLSSSREHNSIIPSDLVDSILDLIALYAVSSQLLPITLPMIIRRTPLDDYSSEYTIQNALNKNGTWCTDSGLSYADVWIDFGRPVCIERFTLASPSSGYTRPVKIGMLYLYKKDPRIEESYKKVEGRVTFEDVDKLLKEIGDSQYIHEIYEDKVEEIGDEDDVENIVDEDKNVDNDKSESESEEEDEDENNKDNKINKNDNDNDNNNDNILTNNTNDDGNFSIDKEGLAIDDHSVIVSFSEPSNTEKEKEKEKENENENEKEKEKEKKKAIKKIKSLKKLKEQQQRRRQRQQKPQTQANALNQDKDRDETKCIAIVDLRYKEPTGRSRWSWAPPIVGAVDINDFCHGQWVLLKFLAEDTGGRDNVDVTHFTLSGFWIS